MLSPKNKRILQQILPFAIITLVFSINYSLLEKGILGDHPVYPSTGNPYKFSFVIPAITSSILGLFIGILEVFFLKKLFQKRSFFKKMFFKTLIYLFIIIAAILTITTISNIYDAGTGPLDRQVWEDTFIFFTDFAFQSIMIYFILGLIISMFYTEVSDYIGHAVLFNFSTGKYHHPIEEERIFMFLDMKSSTTIAEKLGHVKYFEMLKEYYVDLSDPIIEFAGEIYQYVGDEVIVTWKLDKGFDKNNYLNCFFTMKDKLSSQAEKYQSTYGVVPTFKAGIHLGKVTTGEIGVIKKEITFSGDVLNTTARIQGLCNDYKVDLLTSEKLVKASTLGSDFQAQALGEAELRGRNEKINLFTIERKR